jgi:15-cis-phytoene synthase
MHQLSSVKLASNADVAACRTLLRGGSRTFYAASLVLPTRVRVPATGLYAFCRMADDAIDHGADRPAALAQLRSRLDRIYAGDPYDIAADRAFADSVSAHAIPKAFPGALLEGFEWDSLSRRYEDLSQLKGYAVRVAGTVGAMMAMVMGVKSRALIARACDLGVAMQLTNIARDVGEDARSGRLYLPLEWMRAVNLDPDAWLANPVFNPQLKRVIQRLLQEAENLYARADPGIAMLPSDCRAGMYAARLMYAEIGHELNRRGFNSITHRAVVPWQQKVTILARAILSTRQGATPLSDERLAEANFILDSVCESAESMRARWPKVEDRVVWLIDLFERLERRERAT